MKLRKYFQDMKLTTRITITFAGIFLPIAVLLVLWFLFTFYYNQKYGQLVKNASVVSDFSLDFKKNFDYEIYLMIVGNPEGSKEAMNTIENDIQKAEQVLSDIDLSQENEENIRLIEQNQKYLEKLRGYAGILEKNIETGGKYDENKQIWENDVMVVTTLIRENILQILHNETKEIAGVRSQMETSSRRILIFSGFLLIIAVLLGIFMMIMVSQTVTRPILYLQKLTERVAGGDLEVRSELQTGAEVKKLSDSLNTMIEQISTLIERNRLKQIRLREAELEVLQTQINPHFLYNTLDTIVWLAEAGRQHEVVEMVEDLSDFFRATLNNGKDVTLVEQEFVHAESYLKIQKVRYRDILCYDIQLPPSLKQYRIPKITLQPLVENALYHGIKNKRGQGTIRIGGREEENRAVLFVKDNGIGMTKERLEQIRKGLLPEAERSNDSYGLYNVNERLRLKFGAEYHLEIESEYGVGTTVWIYLPKRLEEDTKQADRVV
jgi:two-component system sensor histidine kinase YesM